MQKDPSLGFKPSTFLLQGNSAINCAILQSYFIRLYMWSIRPVFYYQNYEIILPDHQGMQVSVLLGCPNRTPFQAIARTKEGPFLGYVLGNGPLESLGGNSG